KQYLEKHEIDTRYIPDILDNLIAEDWLNDQQYVENYLAQNLHSGDKGPYILKQKLMQKGIDIQVIEQGIAQLDFSEVAEKTAKKLHKKYQSKLSSKSLTDKIIQNLMNKGFSYDEAKTAFENLIPTKTKNKSRSFSIKP